MLKTIYEKIFGSKEVITIEDVSVIGDFTKSLIEESGHVPIIFRVPFSGILREIPKDNNVTYRRVEISAKKKDGSIISGVYDIPSYCAHGIIDIMKKLEGREVSVWMKNQLPRRLPYMSF